MTHLTRDELVAWRDRPADAERARVTAHLGACRPCASAYAELLRTAPAGQPAHFRPADFVERGYAVRESAGAASWVPNLSSWRTWGGALSAAAALILVVTLGTQIGRDTTDGVRGSLLELTTPSRGKSRAQAAAAGLRGRGPACRPDLHVERDGARCRRAADHQRVRDVRRRRRALTITRAIAAAPSASSHARCSRRGRGGTGAFAQSPFPIAMKGAQ